MMTEEDILANLERFVTQTEHVKRRPTSKDLVEFGFDPRQPRDKDGKWTTGVQHVASRAAAEAIKSGGFKVSDNKWDRQFGDGVYLSEAGDSKSAKFYARQGPGRTSRTSQVIEGTVSLDNPLHVSVTNNKQPHFQYREKVVEALGGSEKVRQALSDRVDTDTNTVRKILTEELGSHPAFSKLDLKQPENVFLWDFEQGAVDRAMSRVRQETEAGSLDGLGSQRGIVNNWDKVMTNPGNGSDQYDSRVSHMLGNLARDMGHDGIVVDSHAWGGFGGAQIVVFDPTKIHVDSVRPHRKTRQELSAALKETS